MRTERIQFKQPNLTRTDLSYPIYKPVISVSKITELKADTFEKSKSVSNHTNITFSGLGEKLIIRFLKNTTYHRSIRGSKRPYTNLSENLLNITKEIQIPVSKKESINALDINPKNSQNYIIFLHGFSHNITSNQPLYKALTKSDYGILAIDYRGYGKNPKSKHIKEAHIIQDIEASMQYLQAKGIKNIGVIGHSFGGYLAAQISNLHNISFQILIAPLTSLEFWLKNVLKHPKKYPTEMKMIKFIPKFKDQYAKIFNIKQHLIQNYTPTYIVQSKHDKYIRESKVNSLTQCIPNLQSYIVIPTGGHRMDDNKISKISEIIRNL